MTSDSRGFIVSSAKIANIELVTASPLVVKGSVKAVAMAVASRTLRRVSVMRSAFISFLLACDEPIANAVRDFLAIRQRVSVSKPSELFYRPYLSKQIEL